MPLVDSSAVSSINYDPDRKEMYVAFRSGSRYTYFKVPQEVYEDWLTAPSIGEYFSEHIRDHYEYTRRE
jgi:lysyl-tRNA synthetase class 2